MQQIITYAFIRCCLCKTYAEIQFHTTFTFVAFVTLQQYGLLAEYTS